MLLQVCLQQAVRDGLVVAEVASKNDLQWLAVVEEASRCAVQMSLKHHPSF